MKAYELVAVNDLRYTERTVPEIKGDWVLVKVAASGICSSDIPRIFKKGTYHFPTIPGHEFSGRVVAVADEQNEKWIGKRVGIFPLIPCKQCPRCLEKRYEMCENYNYLGSRCDGGFAEYVSVPAWNLIELPQEIGFVEAAMLEPLSVALHCINRAEIKKGDAVAVVGTGMIAFAVAQWAAIQGASRVCMIARNQNKREIAEKLGIEYNIGGDRQGDAFEVVVEAVGTQEALNTAISLAKAGGKVVLMGNPYSDMTIEQNTYWRILRQQLCVLGTWNSSFDGPNRSEWHLVLDALKTKRLRADLLVTHIFPKERLAEGLDLMKNNSEPYCKVMINWS